MDIESMESSKSQELDFDSNTQQLDTQETVFQNPQQQLQKQLQELSMQSDLVEQKIRTNNFELEQHNQIIARLLEQKQKFTLRMAQIQKQPNETKQVENEVAAQQLQPKLEEVALEELQQIQDALLQSKQQLKEQYQLIEQNNSEFHDLQQHKIQLSGKITAVEFQIEVSELERVLRIQEFGAFDYVLQQTFEKKADLQVKIKEDAKAQQDIQKQLTQLHLNLQSQQTGIELQGLQQDTKQLTQEDIKQEQLIQKKEAELVSLNRQLEECGYKLQILLASQNSMEEQNKYLEDLGNEAKEKINDFFSLSQQGIVAEQEKDSPKQGLKLLRQPQEAEQLTALQILKQLTEKSKGLKIVFEEAEQNIEISVTRLQEINEKVLLIEKEIQVQIQLLKEEAAKQDKKLDKQVEKNPYLEEIEQLKEQLKQLDSESERLLSQLIRYKSLTQDYQDAINFYDTLSKGLNLKIKQEQSLKKEALQSLRQGFVSNQKPKDQQMLSSLLPNKTEQMQMNQTGSFVAPQRQDDGFFDFDFYDPQQSVLLHTQQNMISPTIQRQTSVLRFNPQALENPQQMIDDQFGQQGLGTFSGQPTLQTQLLQRNPVAQNVLQNRNIFGQSSAFQQRLSLQPDLQQTAQSIYEPEVPLQQTQGEDPVIAETFGLPNLQNFLNQAGARALQEYTAIVSSGCGNKSQLLETFNEENGGAFNYACRGNVVVGIIHSLKPKVTKKVDAIITKIADDYIYNGVLPKIISNTSKNIVINIQSDSSTQESQNAPSQQNESKCTFNNDSVESKFVKTLIEKELQYLPKALRMPNKQPKFSAKVKVDLLPSGMKKVTLKGFPGFDNIQFEFEIPCEISMKKLLEDVREFGFKKALENIGKEHSKEVKPSVTSITGENIKMQEDLTLKRFFEASRSHSRNPENEQQMDRQ